MFRSEIAGFCLPRLRTMSMYYAPGPPGADFFWEVYVNTFTEKNMFCKKMFWETQRKCPTLPLRNKNKEYEDQEYLTIGALESRSNQTSDWNKLYTEAHKNIKPSEP